MLFLKFKNFILIYINQVQVEQVEQQHNISSGVQV